MFDDDVFGGDKFFRMVNLEIVILLIDDSKNLKF